MQANIIPIQYTNQNGRQTHSHKQSTIEYQTFAILFQAHTLGVKTLGDFDFLVLFSWRTTRNACEESKKQEKKALAFIKRQFSGRLSR